MNLINFSQSDLRKAINIAYHPLSVKDSIDMAAQAVGVSPVTMKKWYYDQETPPRWHHIALSTIIKTAQKMEEKKGKE